MKQPAKFSFDRVFDATGKIVRESAQKTQKKHFSPEEVTKIREEAFTQGSATAESQAAQAVAMAVGEVAQTVMKLLETLDDELANLRNHAIEIALTTGRKIAGAALDSFPTAEIERLLHECVNALAREPRLVVRVAPEHVETLRSRIDKIASDHGFAGRIVLVGETNLGTAVSRIEWSDGGIEVNSEKTADEIAERTRAHLAAANRT
jgi:flagellar assembly protein FliH